MFKKFVKRWDFENGEFEITAEDGDVFILPYGNRNRIGCIGGPDKARELAAILADVAAEAERQNARLS